MEEKSVEQHEAEQEYKTSQPESYLTYLYDTIKKSSIPVVVLFIEDYCDKQDRNNILENQIKHMINEYNDMSKPVKYIRVCTHLMRLPFPEPKTNVLYYFAPGITQQVLTRPAGIALDTFERDIEGIYKMMENPDLELHEAVLSPKDLEDFKKSEEIFEEEEKEEKEYPSFFKMARNATKDFYKTAKRAGTKLPVIAPDTIAMERLEICQGCDRFEPDTSRCRECGCFMNLKANLAASECPIGKWDKYDG